MRRSHLVLVSLLAALAVGWCLQPARAADSPTVAKRPLRTTVEHLLTTTTTTSLPTTLAPPPTLATSTTAAPAAVRTSTSVSAAKVTTNTRRVVTGLITVKLGALQLDGRPYRFTGVNAYHLATDWSINAGCGEMSTTQQLDNLFGSLRPNSLVRFWAFESQATNKFTGQRDWRALDRVFAAAASHQQRLIVTLADDWGRCDGAPKDTEWYRSGFRGAYWNWLHEIVSRYASSPALGMWEPVNEPEVACGSAGVLRGFFDAVGGELHRLDANHLVESGTIGGGQCGLAGTDYAYVHASPGIDVASYHDYDTAPLPGDQWNGLSTRLAQAAQLGKPLIIGEVGMNAGDGIAGCPSTATRRDVFKAKLDAQLGAGIAGFLPWVWSNTGDGGCNHYVVQGTDPSLGLIHDYPL